LLRLTDYLIDIPAPCDLFGEGPDFNELKFGAVDDNEYSPGPSSLD